MLVACSSSVFNCDISFSNKAEKERHKKYMCTVCEITFSHNSELHIHTKTKHRQDNENKGSNMEQNVRKVKNQNHCELQFKCTECKYQE